MLNVFDIIGAHYCTSRANNTFNTIFEPRIVLKSDCMTLVIDFGDFQLSYGTALLDFQRTKNWPLLFIYSLSICTAYCGLQWKTALGLIFIEIFITSGLLLCAVCQDVLVWRFRGVNMIEFRA